MIQSAHPDWFDRTRDLALLLTSWPSVTGTPGESEFAGRLLAEVRGWPGFAGHPEDVWLGPARSGHGAWNLYALVRGQSDRTVLLAGHYDTVGTEDYGEWRPLAGDARALAESITRSLAGEETLGAAERLALADLTGGDFLPGRGLLDMKGGLAAGLAVLERYSRLPPGERPGHLLLVATPDEEGRSSGARAVAHDLPGLARDLGLEIVAGLNLDATADVGGGEEGRAAYLGTVGKVLLSALVVGRPTHAAYPFDGVSAPLLAAELLRRVEASPDLAEEVGAERAAAPACLELRDSRSGYDVTTPAWVWCAFNVLTLRRTPSEVLALFAEVAREVAERAARDFGTRAARAGSLNAASLGCQLPPVLTFGELRGRAEARAGAEAVRAVVAACPSGPDPLRASREITVSLLGLAGLEGPAIILGFGALHYPASHLSGRLADEVLREAVERHTAGLSRETGESLRVRGYFAGISDMSFLGQAADPREQACVAAHTPHPAHVDPVPEGALRFPVVNIGPWGRDYHQRLERIHAPYAFRTVPELLWRLALDVLGHAGVEETFAGTGVAAD
ncbi:M20/M25/M40 family metallo-hydrolase [Deinococcus aestuarii]|uniref:M20/M25/M40 family metallo-hydrolase n=1 Tax=Deinococcus aestuarii TaxID=2774531 RepID=UPI001C0E87A5|nr:M20/M25/M40 family metallo-hydrolase [Deinococcus aestuarii]